MEKEKVLELLKEEGKPMKTGEIAEKLNFDSKTVSRIIKELKKEGKIESPKRCYYKVKVV